jgi:archaeosine-15-forming tRNA-guanine transglycosylase
MVRPISATGYSSLGMRGARPLSKMQPQIRVLIPDMGVAFVASGPVSISARFHTSARCGIA